MPESLLQNIYASPYPIHARNLLICGRRSTDGRPGAGPLAMVKSGMIRAQTLRSLRNLLDQAVNAREMSWKLTVGHGNGRRA
jgi:hypothetical protein